MANLIDKLLEEKDRLLWIKKVIGEDWEKPNFVSYRIMYTILQNKIDEAIAGRMELVDMIGLVCKLKKFDL